MKISNDSIRLEVLWTRLNAMADEAATALVRTAFSSIIRDANDYACALFDAEYNLFAQSTFSGPGFLGALPVSMKKIGEVFPPSSLSPGDALITNDPWICTGHLNDITVVTPIFVRKKIVAYAICCAHQTDIGGRISIAEAKEVFEEGLFIPILKMLEKGVPNPAVFGLIRANVRAPEYVIGDLRAQLASNDVIARRLTQLMSEYSMKDVQKLSHEILKRTEASVRNNISKYSEGTYRSEVAIDTFDDEEIKLVIAITLKNREILVDYTGSTPQISRGVNVCMNYTRSYTTFALKCAISPLIPNNEGVLRPIKIIAPEGSILNAKFPAPVNSRQSVGQFIPEIVFRTLSNLMPECVIAGSGGAPVWAQRLIGKRKNGKRFLLTCVSRGGLGARPNSDGISTLAFPSNTNATPVEILEGDGPIVVEKKELIRDSAGAGKYRGGFGQHIILRAREDGLEEGTNLIVNAKGGRFHYKVPGILGGLDAPKGAIIAHGDSLNVSTKQVTLEANETIELKLPGGGGYGDPLTRDLKLIEDDLHNGLISADEAKISYGAIVDSSGWKVDMTKSDILRSELIKFKSR